MSLGERTAVLFKVCWNGGVVCVATEIVSGMTEEGPDVVAVLRRLGTVCTSDALPSFEALTFVWYLLLN